MSPKYVVRIILFKCTDLIAADSGIEGNKSDPYVEFTIHDITKKSTRKTNDLNPIWSPPEKFEFTIPTWEHEFITVHVWDHDRFSRDDLLGSAAIPLGLYAGSRHSEMYRYPLVLPDDVDIVRNSRPPHSDIYLQVSLTTTTGAPVHFAD